MKQFRSALWVVCIAAVLTTASEVSAQGRRGGFGERGEMIRSMMQNGSIQIPGQPAPGQPAPATPSPPQNPMPDAGQGGNKPVTRPDKPATPPNPEELKVRPTPEGKLTFNFKGQPWLDVLEWLATISNKDLDYQEVPGGFLNLKTQRPYTIEETVDSINRLLLDRGYTLLLQGDVMTLANIKKLDPSMVPRVRPQDLEKRLPHEFVKVSFDLGWMMSDTAIEEVRPMLSPNGKITALRGTNRLDVMDSAALLQEVHEILQEEQSSSAREQLVRKFTLQHTRAAEVLDQLYALLGIDKPRDASGGSMNPQEMMMRQQQMMMMQQQQQQMAQMGGGGGFKQAAKVYLAANHRENSIMANAPADKMAAIEQAIKELDVPSESGSNIQQSMIRWRTYRLVSIDPDSLIQVLNEMGNLGPTTRLTVDKKSKAIIAYASMADHLAIKTVIDKLDGSDRKFRVIPLRKLEAEYVAGTIQFMMGPEEKKDNNRRSWYSYDWGYGGGRSNEATDDSRKFRVDADIEHNRLLLFANPIEEEEVNNLLVQLGELPPPGGNPSTMRAIDVADPDQQMLLEKLLKEWPSMGRNPIEVDPSAKQQPQENPRRLPLPEQQQKAPTGEQPKEAQGPGIKAIKLLDNNSAMNLEPARRADGSIVKTISLLSEEKAAEPKAEENKAEEKKAEPAAPAAEAKPAEKTPADAGEGEEKTSEKKPAAAPVEKPAAPAAEQPAEEPVEIPENVRRRVDPAAPPAPIKITRGPDGKLYISSDDTEALDRMEDLMTRITPRRTNYKIFQLKYPTSSATYITWNLEDFFKATQEEKTQDMPYWYYDYPQDNKKEEGNRLSKKKPLKFIPDYDTNTILVTGADAEQLQTIQELINLYDRPVSQETVVRHEKVYTLKYSKARVVCDTLKDVYKDLLSVNDTAMQKQGQNGQEGRGPAGGPTYNYNYSRNNEKQKKEPEAPIRFKGLISIGVDDLSNSLVVSASGSLIENVEEMIMGLDKAAMPTVSTVQVMKVGQGLDAALLQEKLDKLLGNAKQQAQQQQANQNQPNQQQQQIQQQAQQQRQNRRQQNADE